jgi:hypothetical protein
MFLPRFAQGNRGRIWKLLQKTVYVCLLVVIFVLVFRAGDLSIDVRDYVQDRLAELGITLQQN